ncbi:MAG TPA: hypothetical protein VJQ82_25140 [Terriglobales bacterium]|nr:hypothetical protein [Terriglobales bacterium]
MRQSSRWTNLLAVAGVAGSMLLFTATVPKAYADDREKCEHRIEKAEHRLDKEIREHGERSPQASERRHDLNAEREHCWNQYHGWWDGRTHQWHDRRDWDDDHDRDHDRDDHH